MTCVRRLYAQWTAPRRRLPQGAVDYNLQGPASSRRPL